MDFLKDRRTVLVLAGAAVALLAGLIAAWIMVSQHRGETTAAPPASRAGLVIDSSGAPTGRLDPAKGLRCFVSGQFVGELTLAECAKRNGVATDALDVGLDQNGVLAADQTTAAITPLPPADSKPEAVAPADPAALAAAAQAASGPPGTCLRYADGQWRKVGPDAPLGACVQTLFAGRCARAGEAAYGRWSQQTLRLTPGGVEISGDNRNFRTLMDQPGCPPAPAG
jgi:hypothetical protein